MCKLSFIIRSWQNEFNFIFFKYSYVCNIFKSNMKVFLSMLINILELFANDPNLYLLIKFNNRNTKSMCEIYSKLPIKMQKRRHWRRSGVLLLTLYRCHLLFRFFYCWLWRKEFLSGSFILDVCSTAVFCDSWIIGSLMIKINPGRTSETCSKLQVKFFEQ